MVWKITAEELVIRYDYGERNFAGVKVIPAHGFVDLKGFNLQDINLRGANLRTADLTGADLTGADLTSAILTLACLEKAIVRNASLYSANLLWANLSEADLRGSILHYMNATCAHFDGAINIGAIEYAILADTSFRDAHISHQLICRGGNLIWRTIMPDGSIKLGPEYGDGKGR